MWLAHQATRIGNMALQIAHIWVLQGSASGLTGLADGKVPGRSSKPSGEQRRGLVKIVQSGPISDLNRCAPS